MRFIQTFVWASAVVVLGLLALIFASVALVFLFWDTARVSVIITITLTYLAAFIAAVVGFRIFLTRQPRPFDATLRELREDRACLREES